MVKRWILIGILTISLFTAILLFQPPKDDGLDFIRQHSPNREFISRVGDYKPGPSGRPIPITLWDRAFVFDKVPEQLDREIKSGGQEMMSLQRGTLPAGLFLHSLPNGRYTLYYSKRNMIVVTGEPSPSWLAQQWHALRRRMGVDFKTPRSSK